MAIALVLFCNKTNAALKNVMMPKTDLSQKKEAIKGQDSLKRKRVPLHLFNNYPFTKEGASDDLIKEYKAIVNKYIKPDENVDDNKVRFMPPVSAEDRAHMETIFKQMSREQQAEQKLGFVKNPGPLKRIAPTRAQLTTWKNKKVYGVWIDEKHIDNAELDNAEPTEFAEYFVSRLTPAARWGLNKGHSYQVNLMTTKYYDDYVKESRKNIMVFRSDRKAKGYSK
jgi:hypothetical protein